MTDAAKQGSLWADLVDVWEKAGKTAGIITLPALSLTAIVNKALEPVLSFWAIIVLTWPLVISAMVIALIFWRDDGQSAAIGGMKVFAAIVVPFAIAQIAGVAPPLPYAPDGGSSFPFSLIEQIFGYYFSAYGLPRTISAAICGVFLAWVFQKKLIPRIRREGEGTGTPSPPPPTTP
jgi:hypothetical protein